MMSNCFTFQKSIKSQPITAAIDELRHCFTFQKSIKSQLHGVQPLLRRNCFTFQKSIKSQHALEILSSKGTVSHSKRASNHNISFSLFCELPLFHIPKEHQITTCSRAPGRRIELFHIPKEHQITTQVIQPFLYTQLFHIPKEHQITTATMSNDNNENCFTFQKSIAE